VKDLILLTEALIQVYHAVVSETVVRYYLTKKCTTKSVLTHQLSITNPWNILFHNYAAGNYNSDVYRIAEYNTALNDVPANIIRNLHSFADSDRNSHFICLRTSKPL